MATCSIPDCETPVRARGWCGSHYEKWRRHGDPGVSKWHGHAPASGASLTYRSWKAMKNRMRPSHHAYNHYGGRGITIHQPWIDSFEAFLADVGERPEGMTLDRIDPDGNYEPGNVRWATHTEQMANRRASP